MDLATLEADIKAEVASVVSVLDLVIKYETPVAKWVPDIAEYLPFVVKLDAGLKAFLAALA